MWTEEMIREELRRLDEMTGLHGSEVPIHFGKAKSVVGCFVLKNGEPYCFRFSRYYFDHPNFARGSALEVIAHEYAHYMDFCQRGTSSHGDEWKACCAAIGEEGLPRCFSSLLNLVRLAVERDVPLAEALDWEDPFESGSDDVPKRRKKAASKKDDGAAAA